jgi:predicted transcriptional regulator
MSETTTMTVRLSQELKDKLERLAESTKRSKSYLAAEAIAEYVDLNAWQVEEIRKAVEKADAGGPFVAGEDASSYLDALARGEKPEPPNTFRTR